MVYCRRGVPFGQALLLLLLLLLLLGITLAYRWYSISVCCGAAATAAAIPCRYGLGPSAHPCMC